MERYTQLAQELMETLDKRKKGPPNEHVNKAIRGEMAVMRLLMTENKPMTAGDLSKALSMSTPRVAAVLGSLEKKGMLLRSADKSDKRRVLATLTEHGRAFCEEKRNHVLSDMAGMLKNLGEQDAADFVRIIKRIHETMPDHPPVCEKGELNES